MFVPHILRLKDPALISRWEQIVPFLAEVPWLPDRLIFDNQAITGHVVLARRQSGAQSNVFLKWIDPREAEEELDSGQTIVYPTFKVSTVDPFIIKDIQTEKADDPELSRSAAFWKNLKEAPLRLRLMKSTNLLTPTPGELDALLFTLTDARLIGIRDKEEEN